MFSNHFSISTRVNNVTTSKFSFYQLFSDGFCMSIASSLSLGILKVKIRSGEYKWGLLTVSSTVAQDLLYSTASSYSLPCLIAGSLDQLVHRNAKIDEKSRNLKPAKWTKEISRNNLPTVMNCSSFKAAILLSQGTRGVTWDDQRGIPARKTLTPLVGAFIMLLSLSLYA